MVTRTPRTNTCTNTHKTFVLRRRRIVFIYHRWIAYIQQIASRFELHDG